jgi:hypothetical protein
MYGPLALTLRYVTISLRIDATATRVNYERHYYLRIQNNVHFYSWQLFVDREDIGQMRLYVFTNT